MFEAARQAYKADQRGAKELNESFHFAVMKYPRAVLSYLSFVVMRLHCSATFLQNLNRNRIDNNNADLIRREDIIDKDVAVITEEKPGVRQNKPPHHFPHDFSKPLKRKQFML